MRAMNSPSCRYGKLPLPCQALVRYPTSTDSATTLISQVASTVRINDLCCSFNTALNTLAVIVT